jgi:hypothetical protein
MNLIIPASFVDIRNPAEERLVADAARRGLFVSQHHIEPLGVSGFGFANYWRDRGEEVPFSFVRHRDKFAAIWRDYARRWARYAPRVVWQLGLRGVADRPVWASDPAVPKSAADRGRLISEAMAMQATIVREVDPRKNPPMTATLWMEGSELHRQGHLTFPPGVCVVFADNSPGWSLPRDFHEAEREPGRPYGLYYHHQLWGSGPHLVQAVSPQRTHAIFEQVLKTGATHYAILNAGNVREFVLGLDASAGMLRDFDSFDPERFLTSWFTRHFSPEAERAEQCYRQFFDSFVDEQGRRRMLDGETLHTGRRFLNAVFRRLRAKERRIVHRPDVVRRRLATVREQRTALEAAGEAAPDVRDRLTGKQRQFFQANFMAQRGVLLGLLRWLEANLQAGLALNDGDHDAALSHLEEAQSAFADIRRAQALVLQAERWRHWYRGDRKMNLARARKLTAEVLAFVGKMAEGD